MSLHLHGENSHFFLLFDLSRHERWSGHLKDHFKLPDDPFDMVPMQTLQATDGRAVG